MYWLIYVLAAATAAIISLVAIWAARSRWHWFWRGAALLTCFLLLVPIGAAELNLLFAPVALILFLASAGQQWWRGRKRGQESIREQDIPPPTASIPNRLPTPSRSPFIRFAIKDLFLAMFLAAVAAWIIARIVQDGILLDWRKLPIAIALMASIAWLSFTWFDHPRKWQPMWARMFAYMIGLAMIPASVNALIHVFQWESGLNITIAAASVTCLTMIVLELWLVHIGRMPQLLFLACAVCAAAYIHAEYLGDWLAADYLLREERPTFWLIQRVQYGALYTLLAGFVLIGALLARGASYTGGNSGQRTTLSRLCLAAPVLPLAPLSWIYWQLTQAPEYAAPSASTITVLDEAHVILEQCAAAHKTIKPPVVGPSPELRRLASRLCDVLATPRTITHRWNAPEDKASMEQQIAELRQLSPTTWSVFGLVYYDGLSPLDADTAAELSLAQVRYAAYAQQYHTASIVLGDYYLEMNGHVQLASNYDQISADRRRQLLAALQLLEQAREPAQVTIARQGAWSERHEKWRCRLYRTVLGFETRGDSNYPYRSFRGTYNQCVAVARLSLTHLAIREFVRDHGHPPANLSELTPQYLDSVPVDPYCGQPFVYCRDAERYDLYSVAANGVDDGGHSEVLDFRLEPWVAGHQMHIAKSRAAAQAAAAAPKTGKTRPAP